LNTHAMDLALSRKKMLGSYTMNNSCTYGRTIKRRGQPSRCKKKPGPKTSRSRSGGGGGIMNMFRKADPKNGTMGDAEKCKLLKVAMRQFPTGYPLSSMYQKEYESICKNIKHDSHPGLGNNNFLSMRRIYSKTSNIFGRGKIRYV